MVSQAPQIQTPAGGRVGQLLTPESGRVELLTWFSWPAILSGSFLTLALLAISGIFSWAVGIDFTFRTAGSTAQMAGVIIWGGVAALLCYGLGGMIAGRGVGKGSGTLNGLVVWAVATTFLFMFVGAAMGPMLGRGAEGVVRSGSDRLQEAAWWSLVSLGIGLCAALGGGYLGAKSVEEVPAHRV